MISNFGSKDETRKKQRKIHAKNIKESLNKFSSLVLITMNGVLLEGFLFLFGKHNRVAARRNKGTTGVKNDFCFFGPRKKFLLATEGKKQVIFGIKSICTSINFRSVHRSRMKLRMAWRATARKLFFCTFFIFCEKRNSFWRKSTRKIDQSARLVPYNKKTVYYSSYH